MISPPLFFRMQEVTDAQGRRRFHGAFTGGFSAGYFNTVGSAEGWAPTSFKSSRSRRASAAPQNLEQFLDEDELEEFQRTQLRATATYDTFGAGAAEDARRRAAQEAAQRPAAVPGLVPDEIVAPVAQGVGMTLLRAMGWRQGRGIGERREGPSGGVEEVQQGGEVVGIDGESGGGDGDGDGGDDDVASASRKKKKRKRWGRVVGIGAENTPLHLVQPKQDVHGLGFDPFKGAEEFRLAKQRRTGLLAPKARSRAGGDASSALLPQGSMADDLAGDGRPLNPRGGPLNGGGTFERRRGIAFGTGALEDDDTYGMVEDYVGHDDVESYDTVAGVDERGMPLSRGPKVNKSGLGDRLALRGYGYEVQEEEHDDEDDEDGGMVRKRPYKPLAIAGPAAPMLLQSLEHASQRGLIPGFVGASEGGIHKLACFPPPLVPRDYVPLPRRTSQRREVRGGSGSSAAGMPPKDATLDETSRPQREHLGTPKHAMPPKDAALRQDIERLAAHVARHGPALEKVAREAQARSGTTGATPRTTHGSKQHGGGGSTSAAYLIGGEGSSYYRWRVYQMTEARKRGLGATTANARPLRAIGQRTAPLTAEERGGILGEAPLQAVRSAGGRQHMADQAAIVRGGRQGETQGAPGQSGAQNEGVLFQAQTKDRPTTKSLARSLLNVAEADRQRLAAMLGATFVRPQDASSSLQGAAHATNVEQGGLRPGAAQTTLSKHQQHGRHHPVESLNATTTEPPNARIYADPARKVITAADLSRSSGAAQSAAAQAAAAGGLPVRRVEEWRPEPLLCKRLDVPDPYKGKAREVHVSRFKSDYFALPNTAAAAAAAAAGMDASRSRIIDGDDGANQLAVGDSGAGGVELPRTTLPQQQREGPPMTVVQGNTWQEEERNLGIKARSSLAAENPYAHGVDEEDEALGAADAFLDSLLGEGGMLSPADADVVPVDDVALERPIDVFKAIFEDTSDESESEKEELAEPLGERGRGDNSGGDGGGAKDKVGKDASNFGFAKLLRKEERAAESALDTAVELPPEMRERAEAALRILRESRKHKKDKKRGDERKRRRSSASRERRRDREEGKHKRKHRRRHSRDGDVDRER
jgi:G patch domain-containing protein 1